MSYYVTYVWPVASPVEVKNLTAGNSSLGPPEVESELYIYDFEGSLDAKTLPSGLYYYETFSNSGKWLWWQ